MIIKKFGFALLFTKAVIRLAKRLSLAIHRHFYLLHKAPGTDQLWMTEDGKIGMDGGAVYGGVLHGVVFGHNGIIERYA